MSINMATCTIKRIFMLAKFTIFGGNKNSQSNEIRKKKSRQRIKRKLLSKFSAGKMLRV